MNDLKKFSYNSLLYAVGNMLQRGASFLLIPIYTSVLNKTEYGAYETLQTSIQLLMVLINFGISNAVLRYYSMCKDENEVQLMTRTAFILSTILAFISALFMFPFLEIFSASLFQGNVSEKTLTFVLLWAIGCALNQQTYAYYRAKQFVNVYVLISVFISFLLVFLNIYFVRFLGMGVRGIVFGSLLSFWIVNILLIIRLFGSGFQFSWFWCKKILNFGFTLIISMFGWLILNSSDRYFLAHYCGLSEVGIYGLGYKVGLISQMLIVTPFQLAWGPFVFSKFAEDENAALNQFSRIFTYFILGFCFMGWIFFSLSPYIVGFLGNSKFPESIAVVPYVLVSYLFNGVFYWAAGIFHLKEKTFYISVIVFLMACCNLILNWLLIPLYGWKGAAIATCISISLTGMLTILFSRKILLVHLEYIRILKLFFISLILIFTYKILVNSLGFPAYFYTILIITLFLFLLYILRFFDPKEGQIIKKLFSNHCAVGRLK